MRVKELVEFIGNDKNKMLKPEQLQAVVKKFLNVTEYLSIKDKKQLVEDIVDACILYEDGIFKFDEIEKYVVFIMKTIDAYTDIELSNDIEDDYDMLCRANVLELVISTFKKEYDDVSVLLSMKCDYILSNNNMEAQFGKFLNNISDKIDILSTFLADKFGNFDINKLPVIKESIARLMDFISTQK